MVMYVLLCLFCRVILSTFKGTLFQFHRNLYAFLMSYVSSVHDYFTPRKEELSHLSAGGDLGTVLEEVRYNHIHCTYVCVYVYTVLMYYSRIRVHTYIEVFKYFIIHLCIRTFIYVRM